MTNSNHNIMAVDSALGGDAGQPGIAQPVTLDEVRDIFLSNRPTLERQTKLQTMRRDLIARHSADTESGFDALIAEIDRGIAILSGNPIGSASPDVLRKTDKGPA
ncbi:hypothetical protein [Fretibacter rubidus]|uniref:hypothetical protein n=1 Tax=Fretibacter rubidus TaxID=570162 RepID=UPI00352ACCF7